MAIFTVDESQRRAAKVAGFLYLLTTLAANFTEFYVRQRLNAHGDAIETARNIAGSGRLFRIGIAGDLITIAGSVALVAALFVILKPVSRNLALIAAFWALVECSIGGVIIANNYAALLTLQGIGCPLACDMTQLPAAARLLVSVDTAGNRVAALFFGLASTLFCYLWFRSRYVPRLLAAWGILASLVPIIIPLSTMMLPAWQDFYLRRARTGTPIAIFGIVVGFWLLMKGIRSPASRARD